MKSTRKLHYSTISKAPVDFRTKLTKFVEFSKIVKMKITKFRSISPLRTTLEKPMKRERYLSCSNTNSKAVFIRNVKKAIFRHQSICNRQITLNRFDSELNIPLKLKSALVEVHESNANNNAN